jgi:hypothetical protein
MQIINAVSPSFARMPPVVSAKKMDEADSVVPKLDLIAGALEMKLVMLSIELSGVIDQALEARMQSQKDRNAQIENLNDLLNALRKLQKSSATFSADSLDKTYIDLPLDARSGPERAMRRKEKEIQKEQEIAAADAAENTVCKEVETWGNKSTSFLESYSAIERFMDIKARSARADGSIAYTGINRTTGQWETQYLKAHTSFWYPSWGPDKIRAAYADRRFATARIENKYKVNPDSDKTSLADLLYQYGVYKKGEALPATKEDLEAASEKISAMVSTITSTQSLKMLDIQKFTNGRNEAYDLAVSVNNSKFESLKSLISMIGEH